MQAIIEKYKTLFDKTTLRLRATGYDGEVLLNDKGLFLTAVNEYDKQVLRVVARKNPDFVTYFPKGSRYGFACFLTGALGHDAKKELKQLAIAA
jgi:hypothetical protein